MPQYRYELRHAEAVVATGHFERADPLEVGDQVEIAGRTGIVRDIQPVLGEAEHRLLVQLLHDLRDS